MARFFLTSDICSKIAVLATGVGLVAAGALGSGAGIIAAAAAPLAGSLSVPLLRRLVNDRPECAEALASAKKKVSRQYEIGGEATAAEIAAALSELDQIIDRVEIFDLGTLRRALDGRETAFVLTEHTIDRIGEQNSGFRGGLRRDMAEAILSEAYSATLEVCVQFRGKITVAYLERILGTASNIETKIGALQSSVDELPNILELLMTAMASRLMAESRSAAELELGELPRRTNIAPLADRSRELAKAAMDRNDIAEALGHMQAADVIEAFAEAEALKTADRLSLAASEAREEAAARSLSRARSLAACASLSLTSGDPEAGVALYRQALSRLPEGEGDRRTRYRSGLRRGLNRLAAARSAEAAGQPGLFEELRTLLFDDREAAPPDAFSFNILIAKAPHLAEALEVFDKMSGLSPDVFTFGTLIAKADDVQGVLHVLGMMAEAGVTPNAHVISAAGYRVKTREDATRVRSWLIDRELAGTAFYRAVFSRLCPDVGARDLLSWCFSNRIRIPDDPFGAAIRRYRNSGKLDDALRIAMPFPFLEASRSLFLQEEEMATSYLTREFVGGDEPEHAARALGYLHEAHGRVEDARTWLTKALEHPRTRAARKPHIEAKLADLAGTGRPVTDLA